MSDVEIDPADLAFSLPNVGPGPNPCSLAALAANHDAVLLLLQRDYYCTNCRDQVQTVAERYEAFRDRGVEVVSVVPEPEDRVADWQARYDLPFPLLADETAAVGEQYDQPVRFGILGRFSDFFGRMPEAVILDTREEPRVAWVHRGSSTFDRPSVQDLLDRVDEVLADPPGE